MLGSEVTVKEARWCRRQTSSRTENGLEPGEEKLVRAQRARGQVVRERRVRRPSTSRATCASLSSASTSPSSHPGSRVHVPRRGGAGGFPVLAGEGLLLVEGEERRLRQWDFFHCPPWTEHVIVGAGEGRASSSRSARAVRPRSVLYPARDVALRHGAGVRRTRAPAPGPTPRSRSPRPAPTAKAICPGGSRLGRGRQSQQALGRYPMAGRRQAPR